MPKHSQYLVQSRKVTSSATWRPRTATAPGNSGKPETCSSRGKWRVYPYACVQDRLITLENAVRMKARERPANDQFNLNVSG